MIALETLVIEQVMIHRIPKAKKSEKGDNPPELSDEPIKLDPELKKFFRERLQRSLTRAFKAVYLPPAGRDEDDEDLPAPRSEVPELIVGYFKSDMKNLVEMSRDLAVALHARQGGNSSEGLLVVADARVGSGTKVTAVLAVLKLEDDQALLVVPSRTSGGGFTFEARIQNVTLPQNSKVFKAAVFPRTARLGDLEADVSDHQRDTNLHGPEVADFFLEFLGCRLRETADRATKGFVDRAVDWINTLSDDADKSQYLNALLADVGSNSSTIDPRSIAITHFKAEDQDSFLASMRNPDGSIGIIHKDRTLLGGRLDRVTYEFEGGVKLTGPRESVEQLLESTSAGWTLHSRLVHTSHGGR